LWGQEIGGSLSTLTVSVAGLYSPPGEMRVGGSGELGKTQTVPVAPGFCDAGFAVSKEVCAAPRATRSAARRMEKWIEPMRSNYMTVWATKAVE
jgi:hypothetical protein